jgi:hypothetical protein
MMNFLLGTVALLPDYIVAEFIRLDFLTPKYFLRS